MLAVTKLSAKYQLTLPQEVREAIQAKIGDRIVFRQLEDGSVVVQTLKGVQAQKLFGALSEDLPEIGGVGIE